MSNRLEIDYFALVPASAAIILGGLGIVVMFVPPQTTGTKIIYIVAITALTIAAIVFTGWSQRRSAKHAAKETKRFHRLREQCGMLMSQGQVLLTHCLNEKEPDPTTSASEWSQRVETFLNRELGSSYVARFRNQAGLPLGLNPISIHSISHRNVYPWVLTRLARLEQFITEIGR
jgi:hypothetical protein